jgi:hypothetical protein
MSNIVLADALAALNIEGYIIYGKPTNETEFNSMFRKIMGVDDNNTGIESSDPADFGVTWAQVKAKAAELQAEYDAQQYARDRAAEYPSVTDYIDGVVKGNQAQIDAYIAACQAVKAKYPKPE